MERNQGERRRSERMREIGDKEKEDFGRGNKTGKEKGT